MTRMSEEEALVRAREAYADVWAKESRREAVRGGEYDESLCLQVAKRALLDLDKPIVDPDIRDLREIVAAFFRADDCPYDAKTIENGHSDEALVGALPVFRRIIEERRGK